MNQMAAGWLCLVAMTTMGCMVPWHQPDMSATLAEKEKPVAVGENYVIQTIPQTHNTLLTHETSQITYYGRVVKTDDEAIVLTDVQKNHWNGQSVPLFKRMPRISRYFDTIGTGTARSDQEVIVPREQISSIEPAEPASVVAPGPKGFAVNSPANSTSQ